MKPAYIIHMHHARSANRSIFLYCYCLAFLPDEVVYRLFLFLFRAAATVSCELRLAAGRGDGGRGSLALGGGSRDPIDRRDSHMRCRGRGIGSFQRTRKCGSSAGTRALFRPRAGQNTGS